MLITDLLKTRRPSSTLDDGPTFYQIKWPKFSQSCQWQLWQNWQSRIQSVFSPFPQYSNLDFPFDTQWVFQASPRCYCSALSCFLAFRIEEQSQPSRRHRPKIYEARSGLQLWILLFFPLFQRETRLWLSCQKLSRDS